MLKMHLIVLVTNFQKLRLRLSANSAP